MRKHYIGAAVYAAIVSLLPGLGHATALDGKGSYYWTGAVDGNFAEPGNWVYGSPTGPVCTAAPINNDWECSVYFTDETLPATKAVNIPGRTVYRLIFKSSGWTISGGSVRMKELLAQGGSGTIVTFAQSITISGAGNVSCVPEGTLVFSSGIYQDLDVMKFQGGGTFELANFGGWNKKRTYTIANDSLVRVNWTTPFSGTAGKSVTLLSPGARVQYKSTAAVAETKFGLNGEGSNGLVNGCDEVLYYLIATDLGDGFVEVGLESAGLPEIESASLTKDEMEAFGATALMSGATADVYARAVDDSGVVVETLLGTSVAEGDSAAALLVGLQADTTYAVTVVASNAVGTASEDVGSFYHGVPVLSVTADAYEEGLVPGVVVVTRAAASAYPLEVAYTCTSEDVVAGQTYAEPSGVVTIPAGAASATIELAPLADGAVTEDVVLTFALAAGAYKAQGAASVTMTLHNASDYPTDKNVWIAGPESDGLASTAANWSRGRVPNATDDILVDGLYSNESMVWDAGENGLTDTVASWIQRNYSGTNTVETTYEGAFAVLTITGDCTLTSGVWTHKANAATQAYRLNIYVGGDFTLGESAVLDANRKGYAPDNCAPGGELALHAGGRESLTSVVGSVTQPEMIGAGSVGWRKGPGGGAVKLVVAGDAVVDGLIDASVGANENSWNTLECGAPGSIFVQAKSLTGAGHLNAAAPKYHHSNATAPSGGRIGVVLTEAEELGLPAANLTAAGTLATGRCSSGAGTIFVKTAGETYGTLYVRNTLRTNGGTYGIMIPDRFGTTLIPAGETWTFDRIVFEQAGILAIPEGTTLCLPNGFASITGTSRTAGILALGGTIDAGNEDPYVLQGSWVFHAEAPYTFDRDVVVRNGAAIGLLHLYCTPTSMRRSTVTVQGDLTVAQDGYLYAVESGLMDENGEHNDTWLTEPFAHGGQPAVYGTMPNVVYGSILNPVLPGSVGQVNDTALQTLGGGALIVTVSGHLTLDGQALSMGGPGTQAYTPGGSGGSLNLTAGSLSGNGSISANGFNTEQNISKLEVGDVARMRERNLFSTSGGGRIAVRLTDRGATFPEGFTDRVTALGGVYAMENHWTGTGTNTMSSAGTIYLQDGTQGEGAGTVIIRNGSRSFNVAPYTPFPSTTWGGEEDHFRAVTLSVGGLSRVALTQSTKVAELVMEEGTAVNLCGKVLTATRATLGGERIAPGYYAATDPLVAGYVIDSSEEGNGMLYVAGDCTMILFR